MVYLTHKYDGFTVLEALVWFIILVIAGVALHGLLTEGSPAAGGQPSGLLPSVMAETGNSLRPIGEVTGFTDGRGDVDGVSISSPGPDPRKLRGVVLTIGLFIGDMGAVDMNQVSVEWKALQEDEKLSKTSDRPVTPSQWTIAKKFNLIPYHQADEDDLLEPNEQFELLIYPAVPLDSYETFTLTIRPPGAVPLSISRTVPARITPIMNLG